MKITNKDVVATLTNFSSENIKITSQGGNIHTFTENGEFIFEFMDEAGNSNSVTTKVDWIDKNAPTASIKYDKSNKNKAIVRVVNASKEITFEVGSGIYEFTKNGTYEIVFYDKFGNRGVLVAVIDWLNNGSGDIGNSNSINGDRGNNKITSDNVVNDTKSLGNVKDNNDSVMDKDTKTSKYKNNYIVLFGIIFFVLISMVVIKKEK